MRRRQGKEWLQVLSPPRLSAVLRRNWQGRSSRGEIWAVASCLQAQAQREARGTQLQASDNRHLPLDGKEEADGCLGCYTDLSQRPLRVGSNLDEGSVSYEKCLSCPSLLIGQPATTFAVQDAGVGREKPQPQLPLSWKPWLGGKQHGLSQTELDANTSATPSSFYALGTPPIWALVFPSAKWGQLNLLLGVVSFQITSDSLRCM